MGGHVALAGTYHFFLKEIPLHQEYEILLFFGGWEAQKWVYLTAAYITRGTKRKGKGQETASTTGSLNQLSKGIPTTESLRENKVEQAGTPESSLVLVPPITEGEGLSVPVSTVTSGAVTPVEQSAAVADDEQAALDAIRLKIPADATLHAVTVSQYCFKHGRVTVPPRVAFIASGFGDPARWERLMAIRKQHDGLKEMKRLMKGGWKDESWGDFWDFKDCEPRGTKAGNQLRKLRFVMGALAGETR